MIRCCAVDIALAMTSLHHLARIYTRGVRFVESTQRWGIGRRPAQLTHE
jgi:hypothetical protein